MPGRTNRPFIAIGCELEGRPWAQFFAETKEDEQRLKLWVERQPLLSDWLRELGIDTDNEAA